MLNVPVLNPPILLCLLVPREDDTLPDVPRAMNRLVLALALVASGVDALSRATPSMGLRSFIKGKLGGGGGKGKILTESPAGKK